VVIRRNINIPKIHKISEFVNDGNMNVINVDPTFLIIAISEDSSSRKEILWGRRVTQDDPGWCEYQRAHPCPGPCPRREGAAPAGS
jgi:hypothetical protein